MVVTNVGMVFFPHGDLHVARTGTPPLKVSFHAQDFDDTKPDRYQLREVTKDCVFDFFAPHKPVGQRFDGLPSINPATGIVTPKDPGVFLFQVRWGEVYLVGRLQVHEGIDAWWFGNDSITTAFDGEFGHAQPSLYARFTDDATGVDRIGDITGHGYVTLTPDDPAKLKIAPQGRVQGLAETTDPAAPTGIKGNFLGVTNSLPVRVVDYGKTRQNLQPVQTPDVAQADGMVNILFIPEGFQDTDTDRAAFDLIVAGTVRDLFDKPRHQPYAMLEAGFNIFKAYLPSRDHYLTCGFRITDDDFDKAKPIPFNGRLGSEKTSYTMQELVAVVGLPMHNESRFDLVTIWQGQSLKGFEPSRVDPKLIAAWRAHEAVGILHARDTVFGMYLGQRPGDRTYGISKPPVKPPALGDTTHVDLSAFVARLYEFYSPDATRLLTPDPRRNPPERYSSGRENPGAALPRYFGGSQYAFAPFHPIGKNWVPDTTKFTPSRGLVAMICYEDVDGGTNFDGTATAQTMGSVRTVAFTYADVVDKREMRRRDPLTGVPPTAAAVLEIANTVAHEFGHSFNLGDEYEDFEGDGTAATATGDLTADNLSVLGFLRDPGSPAPGRLIDPAKVKWLDLHRMLLSAKITAPARPAGGAITVTIDPRYSGKWVQAQREGTEIWLRNFSITKDGVQLPLAKGQGELLTGLKIGTIDATAGKITLTGVVSPLAEYRAGSFLYIPLKAPDGGLVSVVDKKVKEFLFLTKTPLNRDTAFGEVRKEDDEPVDITGFAPPCNSSKTVGVFEGGDTFSGGHYRPAGSCKMRNHYGTANVWTEIGQDAGAFCYVCKWLIVNRVDPSYHAILSAAFYPGEL
ncbi:hypothetical protein [Amycolatopsis sp. lyj-90]|uniref:hypothetical protein n=1 Tax=Amycolatopsis sp. lyj-90 TaxID=2789285 RepID=UPI00397E3E0F